MQKYMISFKGQPATFRQLVDRFSAYVKADPPKDFKILGFWHVSDGVYALVESANYGPVYGYMAKWSDLVTFKAEPVLDSKEAAEALEY